MKRLKMLKATNNKEPQQVEEAEEIEFEET